MRGSKACLAVALFGLWLRHAPLVSASGASAGGQSSKSNGASWQSNEVSCFFFGIRMRSTSSGMGSSGRSRRMPSDRELAGAPYTCPSCERDENGRMKVLSQSKSDFLRETGYSYGRTGYVIDYIVPLQCGGADAPANMRWLKVAETKAKDVRCAE